MHNLVQRKEHQNPEQGWTKGKPNPIFSLIFNKRHNVVIGGSGDKAILDYDPAGNYSDAVQPDEIANKLALLAPYIGRNNGCLMLSDVV